MVKHCRGRYSDNEIMRCAQMSGSFGKHVDNIFAEAGLLKESASTRCHRHRPYHMDIAKFVDEYRQHGLGDYCPPRHHRGFSGYEYMSGLKNPRAMALKMSKLSEDLDLWRDYPLMERE